MAAKYNISNGSTFKVINSEKVQMTVTFTASDGRTYTDENYCVESIDPVVIQAAVNKTLEEYDANPPITKPLPASIGLPFGQDIILS